MIEIKSFAKSKQGTGNVSGNSTTYVETTVSDAEHAVQADKAKRADYAERADYATRSGSAERANYATKAGDLSEDSEVLGHYLRKDIEDIAQGIITFLKGLKIGDTGNNEITTEGLARLYAFMTYGFQSGPYGTGAQIDHEGRAELQSLSVREFISTPKFVFNEIAVTKAEQWSTNGFGTIESVDLENSAITLKLEENDYGSLAVGDICRGIYADIGNVYKSSETEEGATDDCNFVQHKGFFTTYFYVKRIITSEQGKFVFEYGKKSEGTPEPCAYMDFAQYGSFTDDQRRSSMYFCSRGRSYIEVLDGVDTWVIAPEHRVARYGWLGGLTVKNEDGTYRSLDGNGLFAQNNVYFGGTVEFLKGLSGLDDLVKEKASYDVSLSQYQSVLTVDDMGNVIGGLYTEDEAKTTKQYKISTAVFVRKGQDILLEEDEGVKNVTEGHYRLYAVSDDCEVEVKNSTVFVTGIENIKDGVAGTDDDSDFDYDAMRRMTDAMVTVVVNLEGKTSKTVQMPIRIQHDSLPFMVCDLSNEHAGVAWNTKTGKYIGFPIETQASLYYQNTAYAISNLTVSCPEGLKATVEKTDGKPTGKITITGDGLTGDTLAQVSEVGITVVGTYAGANYEYTKTLTVTKSADTVVYEVVPSVDSVSVDKDGGMSVTEVSCGVYVTSSDDKRYQLTALPTGFALKYGYTATPSTTMELGGKVAVAKTDSMVTFGLYDAQGTELDKESVPVVKDGKYAPKASTNDDIITIPTDSRGNALAAFSEQITLYLTVDGVDYTVKEVEVSKDGLSENATCTVSGNTATIACAEGAELGTQAQTLVFKVTGTKNDTEYSDYVTVKVVPNVTGADGDGYEYVYYRSSSASAPSAPSRSGGTLTSGWADDPMTPTDSYQYVYVAYKTGKIGSDGTFSTPKLWAYKGKDGVGTVTAYRRAESAPASANTYYGLSTSSTTAPTSYGYDTMSSAVISGNGEKWLWSADKVTYTNGTTLDTNAYCVGQCKTLTSITEQCGTSSSASSTPSTWSDTYPSSIGDGVYIWSRDKIEWTDGSVTYSSAQLIGRIGEDGSGVTSVPTVTSYSTFKSSDRLGDGWTTSVPNMGTVSNVSANNSTSGGDWSTVVDGDYSWYKSPTVSDSGIATMRIYFTTSVANQSVTFSLKAYSEANYDFVLVSEVDSTSVGRITGYSARTSGNGVETSVALTCATAGQHFVTVGYAKDGSGSANGDYGLVRIVMGGLLYRCDGTVDSGVITWGTPYLAQGTGVASVTVYYALSTSNTTAPTSGWDTAMVNPTSAKPYLWSKTVTTYTDGTSDESTPVVIGNFAEQGTNGCIVRKSEWAIGVEYRNDTALTTNGVKYLDVVGVENRNADDGYDFYQCVQTHTSSSATPVTDTDYWTKLSNTGPLYTSLLIAKNAVLKFAQTNQLLVMKDDGTTVNVGLGGGDYPLWIGAATASAAAFKVDASGKLYATGCSISGTITAEYGKIGGFTISSSGLTHIVSDSDIGTSGEMGYIICRNDYHGRFAGIGANILPATSGTVTAVAKFENTDSTDTLFSTNIALMLKAENGAQNNYAFYGTGNGILDGWIGGYKLSKIMPSTANTINLDLLSLKENNTFIVYNSRNGVGVALPTLTEVLDALGLSTSSIPNFCVRITVCSDISSLSSSAWKLYGRCSTLSTSTDPYPIFVDENASRMDYVEMGPGDTVEILLIYDSSQLKTYTINNTSVTAKYTAQLIHRRN